MPNIRKSLQAFSTESLQQEIENRQYLDNTSIVFDPERLKILADSENLRIVTIDRTYTFTPEQLKTLKNLVNLLTD